MKTKTALTLSAAVLGLLGAGLALIPATLISARTGAAPDILAEHIARQFGIAIFAVAFIAFRLRTADPGPSRRTFINGLILLLILLPVETGFSILAGTESAEGWLLVGIFLALAAVLIFARRKES